MALENAEKLITDFLINKVTPYVIYLFGSQATKHIHNESDFDIAYLSKQKLNHYERFMLAQELAAKLNRDVDLIDLEQASTVFQAQVINRGKILLCSNENERALFEMRTLKNYARLNEERQDVLKNITERGRVYEE
ncbi:nucleotidyltransferase domain-containing protein [Bacillus songklensis]|uniref:Nucleotidyltransferase domain-containing protein n=1 Tax=Bacillus songklensis TaxID=1069116 RepID=A0ABV8AYL5_9BACI